MDRPILNVVLLREFNIGRAKKWPGLELKHNFPEPRYWQVDFPLLLRYKATVFQFHQP